MRTLYQIKNEWKLLIIALVFGCSAGFSQQEPQFTQYLDNMQFYNPAYESNKEAMYFTLLHRQQWVGIKGAPMTSSFSFKTPLNYKPLEIGVSLLNDRIGPINQTWLNIDASYSIQFNNSGNGRLSFGLKGGVNILNSDFESLYQVDDGDPIVDGEYRNTILGNIGAGIYYHSSHFFVGFSVPRIGEKLEAVSSDLAYDDQRHYYAVVGGYFSVNRMLKIRPSMMAKMTMNAPIAIDLSADFIFYDRFWLGGRYRLMEGAGLVAQMQIVPAFKIGYAFDLPTSKIVRYNYGTHELMLSYDLVRHKKKVVNLRFF